VAHRDSFVREEAIEESWEGVYYVSMRFILRVCITAGALMCAAYLVPGITVASFLVAFLAACVLALLYTLARPLLIILTLPATILTFGLFIFVINASLFWFASSLIDGFEVDGFLPALVGSLVVSVISMVAHKLLA